MSTRHEANHMVSCCHFITQQNGSNAFEKEKEEVVSVFVCNGKAEEAEKSFSSWIGLKN